MPAAVAVAPDELAEPTPLDDARDALAYWEARAERLPVHAVRRRREAREMARRWHARVVEAEREAYGRGLLGALLLVAADGRLPETARHAGRRVARTASRAATALALAVVALFVLGVVAVAEVLSALLGAVT
jgi:hypothetical protein